MRLKPWPKNEMIEMYNNGMNTRQIAEVLSSPEYQHYWIANIGCEWRPHKVSVNSALKRFGCTIRGRSERMTGMHPRKKPWPLEQMITWYKEGMSLVEIALRLSSEDFQSYWRAQTGAEYHPSQKVVNKVLRKNMKLRGRGAPLERNGFWKGGRIRDKGGYVLVKCRQHPFASKTGYVREHRLVVEAKIGRYLLPNEVVHHKDGNTSNNTPSNLELFDSNSTHIRKTMSGYCPPGRRKHAFRVKKFPHSGQLLNSWMPDDLIRKWYTQDRISIWQICHLLDLHPATLSRHLSRMGICYRAKTSGVITEEIREECRQFLASRGELEHGAQASLPT